MHKSFVKLFACAAILLGLLGQQTALAQVITTSSLTGSVVSDQGQPVAGAAITVTHEPTGSAYTATTRADGSFALRGLRPGGPYTIVSRLDGYTPAENREVFLDIDRGADVSLRMRSDIVQLEAFSVTASAADQMFDTSQMGSGTYHNERDIRNLPTGDRSINSLARLDPRVSFNRDPNDRAISVSGLSNRFNSIQVDGVSANDPFGLNANNTAAERNVIPLDSLEALSVNTSPYNPRNAGFVGAQINSITKSGTNQFKGSVYYTYRDQDLVADELDGQPRPLPDFKEKTWGATLGGPIIRNRVFFFLSYEKVDEDRIAPSPTVMLDQATINQIIDAATRLGFDPGSPTPPSGLKLKDENMLAKLDWQITANHRATFRYNDVESSRPTFPGFGTGSAQNNFSFSSHWYAQETKNTSYIGQVISRWSDRLNTEVAYSRSKYHSEPKNATRQPQVQIQNIPVPGSSNTANVTFGTEMSRHSNILDVVTDTVDTFASYEINDNHTLQFGVQYDTADIYNLFVQNSLGNYQFLTLAEFLSIGGPTGVGLNNGTRRYRSYTYNQLIPGVNPAAQFSENNLGIFINDQWRVNPSLTINLGARMDMPGLPDAVPFNQSFFNTFGVRNDASYDGEKIFQPRIGFNWQPELDGKRTIFRGGVGLFYGRAPRVWISNSYSNTGANFRTYTAGHGVSNANTVITNQGTVPPAVSADPDNQPTTGSTPPAQQVAFMDPDFQLPSRWKANIAIERELGFWDLKFTAELEKTWVEKDIFYTNINLAPTRTGPDGRTLYWNTYSAATQNQTTGAWSGSSGTRLVNTGFTNRIIKLGNTDKGETTTMTFMVERPRKKDGWSWRAAYVNTNAKEVLFGTSSVAASNWNNRSVFNTNEQELHRSELEVRHRVTANVTKELEWFSGYRTTFSLFYEGRSGYPFSLTFGGDANGDSVSGNDLIYVPLRSGDPRVRFATAADEARFFQIVDRFGLAEGQAVSANSERYPWVNQFDFSVKQEVKLPGWRHRVILGVDVLNVGNLLNDKWGLIRGSNQFFVKRELVANVTYDGATNQYVYRDVNQNLANGNDFSPSLGRGEPAATRWSILLSARYEF
jgi:hypothetical protein